MPKTYDVVVIGAGPGGYVAAIRLAQLGKSVCVIENAKEHLGGVCLNEGCIPTKALLNSAHLYDIPKEAAKAGIDLEAKEVDFSRLVSCALSSSAQLRSGIEYLFKKNNIDLIIGQARFSSKTSVLVISGDNETEVNASNFIIATGSRPKVFSGLEPDDKNVITSEGVFRLKEIPKSLLVIGGGAIGVEFGSLFKSLGSEVCIVELTGQLLPLEDIDIAQEISKYLKRTGIEILLESSVVNLERKTHSSIAQIKTANGVINKEFEYVLLCVGRSPNTESLGLEKIAVLLEKGCIVVNEKMQTNIKNIYAIGDCINSPMLAHVASAEGILAADVISGKRPKPIDYSSIPSAVYSQFQAASVGLTEKNAGDKGLDIVVVKHFYRSCGKAILLHKQDGFIKIIAEKRSGKILGVHIAGHEASELIHEFVVAKSNNLRVQDIAHTVHAHPTLSELAVDAAKAVFDKPIHG
ncbi:MAG: dihydrolipoyl dehydrogenase [Candidatus Omnitrophota bacterium]